MGVQMVSRGRYEQAIAVLEAICVGYPFHESFVAGQAWSSWRGRSVHHRGSDITRTHLSVPELACDPAHRRAWRRMRMFLMFLSHR